SKLINQNKTLPPKQKRSKKLQFHHLFGLAKHQSAFFKIIQSNAVAVIYIASQNFFGKFIQNFLLKDSFQRPGSETRVITFVHDVLNGIFCSCHQNTFFLQHLIETSQLILNTFSNFLSSQRLEKHHFIDSVQKLRTQGLFQKGKDFLSSFFNNFISVIICQILKIFLNKL